jgi:hypothetical protein|tara:strand:+ start:1810 stop:2691 length:882 start_codon:yes stop_codon:yes gene_type:complete
MNVKEASLISYLVNVLDGKAEMPSYLFDEFADLSRKALEKHFTRKKEDFRLRMSNVGKPLCQLQMQAKGVEPEKPSHDFIVRMIIGDMLEALVIVLLKAAKIEVKSQHQKVSLGVGDRQIEGEYDIELDDGIYDIKSVSPFSFTTKFNADNGYDKIKQSDSFGYISQGHGYGMAANKPFKGWIAINKTTGEIVFTDSKHTDEEKKEVYSKIYNTSVALLDEKPFERCFTDVEEVYYSKPTGNRTLGIECSYCPYKHDCWDNLEFRRQLPSKGKNPKWTWYTKIDPKWMEENVQ